MHVTKRNGHTEPVCIDKLIRRLSFYAADLIPQVDCSLVAQKVVARVFDGVETTSLDPMASETAAYMSITHPDYGVLAARLAAANLQKQTPPSFSQAMERLADVASQSHTKASLLCTETLSIVRANSHQLNAAILHERDMTYTYFGFRTLERQFLLRCSEGHIIERPQYMLMRVALGIHGDNISAAIQCYTDMALGFYTHATPTMFNSGTASRQMASCFLLQMKEDSIDGIFQTLRECALISKAAGGIGVSADRIRAAGSRINGSGGTSNGLVPMLRVFNNVARYVDQGGGKRKGAFAVYLQPWHADILEFLELRKNHGIEEARARDLFYGLWIPDIFMRRVRDDQMWPLFCPSDCVRLIETYGSEFDEVFARYEAAGLARRTVRAQKVWMAILESQMETGTPYLLYKDAANAKSNQKHLGVIASSNLCTEIIQYTAPDEIAVCNLASIALPRFVCDNKGTSAFDFDMFRSIVGRVVRNLNCVIDRNAYPHPNAERSNRRHRPIGIGVQGLANVFFALRLPYDSQAARALNVEIFEHMYYAAMYESVALAREFGPYESYEGSPLSQGLLQCDLWGVTPSTQGALDWCALRAAVKQYGARNSLLIAPMPTATTAQILGNNECFEPITSNFLARRVLAGDFCVVNDALVRDLIRLGIWSEALRANILERDGQLQDLTQIPVEVRQIYKTAWEMSNSVYIDMSADRAPFVCQSQSLNLYLAQPTPSSLTSMHMYAWKKGLKTGMYYLHTRPATDAIKFVAVSQAASCATTSSVCESCSA